MTMGIFTREFIAHLAVYLLFIGTNYAVSADDGAPAVLNLSARGEVGAAVQVTCSVMPVNASVAWLFGGAPLVLTERVTLSNETRALQEKDLDGNLRKYLVANLTVANSTSSDSGEYTCSVAAGERAAGRAVNLDLAFPGRLVRQTLGPVLANATDNVEVKLLCIFEVYKPVDVKWWKMGKDEDNTLLQTTKLEPINFKQYQTTHTFTVKRPEDNGTYICESYDSVANTNITGEVNVIVFAAPKVIIDTFKAIGASQLYLNWTIHAYNQPIRGYNLMYRRLPSSDYNLYIREKIGVKNTSFVIEGLDNSTEYQLKLEVTTPYGSSSYVAHQTVATLAKDPIFVPNISINGFSATSVTIGWAPPSEDIAEYIHYYLLEARKKGEGAPKRAYHSRDGRNLPYMFDDLESHTTYIFRVCACSEFTHRCGDWSAEMEAITMDGAPGRPANMTVACYSAGGQARHMNLTWHPPVRPNAVIKGYNITLTGNATYRDRFGYEKLDSIGPLSKFVTNSSTSVLFEKLEPNTHYTIQLSAMSRSRRRGEEETRHCRTAPAPPDHPARPHWRKIVENEKYMFKMFIPRVSERNGPICCYRVYLVRLPATVDWALLPQPKDIPIVTYEEAHGARPALGAYATDVFSNDKFPPESELVMGDGKTMMANGVCPRCQKKPKRPYHEVPVPKTSTVPTTTKDEEYDLFDGDTTLEPLVEDKRERRSYGLREPYYLMSNEYSRNPMMMDSPGGGGGASDPDDDLSIKDGPLDSRSNYTLFVELIPGGEGEEPLYSDYLNALRPAPTPPAPRPVNVLEIVLQVTCGILALVLLGMVAFCVAHSRAARGKAPARAHVEMNPIQAALRYVEHVLSGRSTLNGSCPPELPPIAKAELPAAYAERQADSDYGFQKEFEMLPDSFPDRTTHASEARENQPKNRYPDIRAYDQTRVKLSQIDGVVGSDYINANYVMGYKERKQYICAQGPTEATVNDFWRMIWEHGLELIVMLTNLEEYSKVKCSKYWPDDVRGARAFGAVSVQHVSERRYSDYIVRELRITKLQLNDEGQPIVENGVKRNGDCKDPSSPPASPRDKEPNGSAAAAAAGPAQYSRVVRQFHFLQWKDFAAPEHAHSILKFIKRINAAWSAMSCRPALVHCSAGVGRTGTLVALDSLTQQLTAEGHVSVFGCVAELRRQRCCLVQSLKQYIFVYRALVEYAHYGDTEIPASKLKTAIDTLRNTPEGADKCLMEHEFEKILSPPVTEPVKSVSAGAGPALRAKNRSAACLPYDRNRVILTPIPGRDFSTYINASFIEAYDNTEGYIITQDPLPGTIVDFWRMVSEHNVHTIVMLSELGEGERKCPRYWDDDTAQYEHYSVQYEQSEPCPYYTRRQFNVVNNKNGDACSVRQLQYHGWPTAEGHVPEVTRGLAELADAAAPPAAAAAAAAGPTLVHCHLGTERSSMFVSLCILISQLRAERRADVNCVARKVRAQRANALDTFLQYEFLHRAILNYAELHNLMDDS